MSIPIQFAYLLSVSFMIIPWCVIFLLRPDLRKKLTSITALGLIAGPVSQIWYLRDYWRPPYVFGSMGFIGGLLEDIMFAGLIISITSVLYNIAFGLKSVSIKKEPRKTRNIRRATLVLILIGSLVLFTDIFHINSIYSSAMGFFIATVLIWRSRPDLIKSSLVGSMILFAIVAIGYNMLFIIWPNMIEDWWLLQNISGILIFGVPLEEFLWFSAWGLVGSSLYEWTNNCKFKK